MWTLNEESLKNTTSKKIQITENYRVDTYFGGIWVFILDSLLAQTLHLCDTCREASTRLDDIDLAVQPKLILLKTGICARCCGRSEVVLVKGNGERRVGWENKLGVALSPVSEKSKIDRSDSEEREIGEHT